MATTWVTITAGDVEAALNAGELDEYRQHAAQIDDPLTGILADVTSLVRGYVSTRVRIPSDAVGIPSELRAAAVDIAIYRLAKRVHLTTERDPQRKTAADAAVRLLESVGRGEFGDFSGAEGAKKPGGWGSQPRIETHLA